jgi:hypothetical protein
MHVTKSLKMFGPFARTAYANYSTSLLPRDVRVSLASVSDPTAPLSSDGTADLHVSRYGDFRAKAWMQFTVFHCISQISIGAKYVLTVEPTTIEEAIRFFSEEAPSTELTCEHELTAIPQCTASVEVRPKTPLSKARLCYRPV